MRLAAFALTCTAAFAVHAAPSAEDQVLALATQARERGCRGHPGTKAPLHWSQPLARAAARIDKGEPAMAAVEKEGYRATRVFHANFVGYRAPADAVSALGDHYCAALTEPRLMDMAFHRDGSHWVIVLAAPLQLPHLADARATASRVLALVNEARARPRQCGDRAFAAAAPVRWNTQLESAAIAHAKDMATHGYLEHQGRDGSTPAQRITRAGYQWRSVGENVAAGQQSADEVVEDWLRSPGHCANLMEPGFNEMGAAFAVNLASQAVVYWAQEFGRGR